MRILIVCDSFKGSISAPQVCKALHAGILHIKGNYDFTLKPISDGGEGSLEIIKLHTSLKTQSVLCVDPLNRSLKAEYAISDDGSAYIESAATCGITLLKNEEKNPFVTSSRGLGMMINDAIRKGSKQIHLFLGGSGTSDGGAGMMSELGVKFYNEEGNLMSPCGGNLIKIKNVKIPEKPDFQNITFYTWSDVTNPLLGPNGATNIFAPQKGANKEDLPLLEEGMKNYSHRVKTVLHNKTSIQSKGSGAAGGLGFATLFFFNAKMEKGMHFFERLFQLKSEISKADWIITGEGCFDSQSFKGKVVGSILEYAKRGDKKVIVVCGENKITPHLHKKNGSPKIFSLVNQKISGEVAMKEAESLLYEVGKKIGIYIKEEK